MINVWYVHFAENVRDMDPFVFHQIDLTETLALFVAVAPGIRVVQSVEYAEIVQAKKAH